MMTNFLLLQHSDPDTNLFHNLSGDLSSKCQYYIEDTFMTLTEDNNENSYFSLLQLNIRSVPCHMSEFQAYLDSLQHKFSIIGLTETWLNEGNRDLLHL